MAEEQISQRRLGMEEEQQTVYEPASYPLPDPRASGRWSAVGDGDALIWTDDLESAGVTWAHATPLVDALWQHFQVAKLAGTPAGVAYELALKKAADAAGPETQGELEGLEEAFNNMLEPGTTGDDEPVGDKMTKDEEVDE